MTPYVKAENALIKKEEPNNKIASNAWKPLTTHQRGRNRETNLSQDLIGFHIIQGTNMFTWLHFSPSLYH